MQLNMGEGETAVTVPITTAFLADGQKLCTVTVLKPLFQTNLRKLRECMGGLLNRRLYVFPFMSLIYCPCTKNANEKVALYWLWQSMYRYLFQLKMYEAEKKAEKAIHFLNVQCSQMAQSECPSHL